MSGEDEGQARYWRNIDQAGRVNFDRKARRAMEIATDRTKSREYRLVLLAEYIKDCCVEF